MKNKETRKKEALERQADYDTLTPQQKVLKLNIKLGEGLGAVKQRRRLAFQLNGVINTPEVKTDKLKKKPYQKPKKS
jgi:hypothetical protein